VDRLVPLASLVQLEQPVNTQLFPSVIMVLLAVSCENGLLIYAGYAPRRFLNCIDYNVIFLVTRCVTELVSNLFCCCS